jgi:hypothetical protein
MKYLPIVFLLLTTGCSTKYTPPNSSDTNTASITITHLSLHQNSTTTVNIYDNEECKETSGYGRLALVGDKLFVPGKNKTVPIAADKKTFLLITGGGNQDMGHNYYKKYHCWNLVSFNPKANGSYEVFVNNPESALLCKASILDKKTGNNVLSLENYKVKKGCGDPYVY